MGAVVMPAGADPVATVEPEEVGPEHPLRRHLPTWRTPPARAELAALEELGEGQRAENTLLAELLEHIRASRAALFRLTARLAGDPESLRAQLIDSQWATGALDLSEYAYSASQAANVPLLVQPRTINVFRVTTIVASVPTGATALVQLGDMSLPLSPGLSNPTDLRHQIGPADLRAITCSATGPVALVLSGEQIPRLFGDSR